MCVWLVIFSLVLLLLVCLLCCGFSFLFLCVLFFVFPFWVLCFILLLRDLLDVFHGFWCFGFFCVLVLLCFSVSVLSFEFLGLWAVGGVVVLVSFAVFLGFVLLIFCCLVCFAVACYCFGGS